VFADRCEMPSLATVGLCCAPRDVPGGAICVIGTAAIPRCWKIPRGASCHLSLGVVPCRSVLPCVDWRRFLSWGPHDVSGHRPSPPTAMDVVRVAFTGEVGFSLVLAVVRAVG
jgi:hypothetical protein